VSLSALQAKFDALSARLSAQDWTLLGALSCERALPHALLEKLSPAPALEAKSWLARAQIAGWVVLAGPLRVGSLKAHYSVHPEYREFVLRRLAASHELEAIARVTRALLGTRSVSDLTLSLQSGSLSDFQRRFAERKRAPEVGPDTRAEWLRSSLCEPFDPIWLRRVWRADALRVAALVLEECLCGPVACDELYAWLSAESALQSDPEDVFGVQKALYQQAILRADVDRALALLELVQRGLRRTFGAAARLLEGDSSAAQAFLDQGLAASFAGKRGALPDCASLAPLYALLLCARDTDQDRALAKRLLSAGSGESNRGALRGLRTFLKYLHEPAEAQRRLDVHQLTQGVGAWEIFFFSLTVHLHTADKWARANWCQLLVRRGFEWQRSGYSWFARLAFLLARTLNDQHYTQEIRRLSGVGPSDPLPSPIGEGQSSAREVVLWDLFSSKPEWQKALEALTEISESEPKKHVQNQRVAWFVDMTNGALTRPALQEFRPAEGWSEGRRISLAELWPLYSELPPEDRRVLDCTRELAQGSRDFGESAPEALIGHPRVLNGARGRAQIEVVRGTCRVETRAERGYITLLVEPLGAELGVNVVPQNETRLTVYRVTPAMQRVISALRGGARIPKSEERALLSVLGKLSESVEVHSPELGSERTLEADPTPCLRFAVHAGAWLVQLGVRPFGERGRFFLAGNGAAYLTQYSDGMRVRCERDLALESAQNRALRDACPTLRGELSADERSTFDAPDSFAVGEEGVLVLLSEVRDSGLSCALEWPESGALRLRGQVRSSALHGRLRVDKGWYLVTGGVRVDELTEASLSELVRAPSLGNGRFLRLPSGDFVEIEARVRRVIAALKAAHVGKSSGAELRVPKSALLTLSELASREVGFDLDVQSRAWLERVERVWLEEFEPPDTLNATLRPYQRAGFRWLCQLSELGLGACLADDMGLGKTVQILALLLARAARDQGPALVVAPTSVCGNWLSEIARFAPTLRAVEYVGKERALLLARLVHDDERASRTVLVCSYTLLQQDQAELSSVTFGTAVLDEAQFIKNAHSLRAKAAYALSAKQRIAATGTPVENHLGDLWSIFQFLNPGMLGDWPHFRRTFLMPVERDGSREATDRLRQLVKPFVLRRMKGEVLADLPAITDVRHDVQLSEDEALRYAILRRQIHDKLYTSHGKRFNKLEVLAEIMRLRRFCCHPALVFPDAPSESSKVEAFLQLVEELCDNQHRALVFSQFVDFLALIRERLDERAIRYEYLDGSTPRSERQRRVAAFQSGSASLFLISLKAGGFGLNLTAADYVIHLDPWWNPAVEAQATDRAHRIGQERPVTVYRLITQNSIEDRIVLLHEKKRGVARALLDGGDAAANLSAEELVSLIAESSENTHLAAQPG
jgi:superfamily II DNA or RNA helicase